MEILLTILILTLVVSLTSVLTRLSPVQIPLPLIQIAAGAVLAQPIFGLHVEFNPELFLLLFIPPLLFAESSKIQPKELIKHSREIISLALVLVLITIFGTVAKLAMRQPFVLFKGLTFQKLCLP
ncbi:cation:proton antiporter, partial [Escherichia coli]|nr:cation:proton antiporter [Escherichia coli]